MACKICQGKQLIPFVNKQGKIVSNAWQYCVCKQDEPEHFRETTPTDFDFPVSWDRHRWVEATYGKGDPGSDMPPITSDNQKSSPLPMQTLPVLRLSQVEGNLVSLRDILKQHVNEAKGKKKPKLLKPLESLDSLDATRESLESLEATRET